MAQTCGEYGRHRQQDPDDAGHSSCPCGMVRRIPTSRPTPVEEALPVRAGQVSG